MCCNAVILAKKGGKNSCFRRSFLFMHQFISSTCISARVHFLPFSAVCVLLLSFCIFERFCKGYLLYAAI